MYRRSGSMMCLCLAILAMSIAPLRAADEPAAAPQAPKPTPLSELKLDLTRLNTSGTRKYLIKTSQENAPNLTYWARTTVKDNEVLIQDRLEAVERNGMYMMDYIVRANLDNVLSLRSMKMYLTPPQGASIDINANVSDGALTSVTASREKVEREKIDCPKGTTTLFALARLATLLPRDEGRRYAVDHVVEAITSAPEMSGPWIIECKGLDESVMLADKKWTIYHIHPADTESRRATSIQIWVDPQGVITRFGDRAAFLELTEEPAPEKKS